MSCLPTEQTIWHCGVETQTVPCKYECVINVFMLLMPFFSSFVNFVHSNGKDYALNRAMYHTDLVLSSSFFALIDIFISFA